MNPRIYLLIKVFDKEEHADAFIQKGEMYCNTLGYFKKHEDELRGDAYEGITDWHQPDQITLTISYKDNDGVEQTHLVTGLASPVTMGHNGFDGLNLYCMYAVKVSEFEESYETEYERVLVVENINAMLKERTDLIEKALSLGEFSVVIYQVEEFINRVKQTAKSLSLECLNGTIQYYDPDTFSGSFEELEAVFRKRNIYADQNEYRFAFGSHEPEGVKTINVGSLDGIAVKIRTNEINEKVQIKLVE